MRLDGDCPAEVAGACREKLIYDPASGLIIWKIRAGNTIGDRRFNGSMGGKAAGKIDGHGRLRINIKVLGRPRYMQGHRVAWLLSFGEWPDGDIDHINHDPLDNRLCKLRCVSHGDNQKNLSLSKSNSSGVNGVSWSKRYSKWRARITIQRREMHVGYFHDLEEARIAVKDFVLRNDFHENHGMRREDLAFR